MRRRRGVEERREGEEELRRVGEEGWVVVDVIHVDA